MLTMGTMQTPNLLKILSPGSYDMVHLIKMTDAIYLCTFMLIANLV